MGDWREGRRLMSIDDQPGDFVHLIGNNGFGEKSLQGDIGKADPRRDGFLGRTRSSAVRIGDDGQELRAPVRVGMHDAQLMGCELHGALERLGHGVGLMDSDIYGPSQQMMMGIDEKPYINPSNQIVPIERYGVDTQSAAPWTR